MKKKYEIGYCKPPKATQFKPGHSGHKHGRPKGVKNTLTYLEKVISKRFSIQEGGRSVKKEVPELAFLRLAEKAIKGNIRAIDMLIREMKQLDDKNAQQEKVNEFLAAEDKEILESFLKEKLEEAKNARKKRS